MYFVFVAIPPFLSKFSVVETGVAATIAGIVFWQRKKIKKFLAENSPKIKKEIQILKNSAVKKIETAKNFFQKKIAKIYEKNAEKNFEPKIINL